jgi:hypothetical protein
MSTTHYSIRHHIAFRTGVPIDRQNGVDFSTFSRDPRRVLRWTYRTLRREGLTVSMARFTINQIVMAADWPD